MSASLRVLVVDDEAPARERLLRLIEGIDGVEVAGSASRPNEVLPACRQASPDVVLLDVEMPGGNGVDVARQLSTLDPEPAVIFVTAFERYAVEAFDVEAIDYLVKPVRASRLEAAFARVRERLDRNPAQVPALLARLGERVTRIPLDEVRALIAEDKYVCVHHTGGKALVEESLVQLEQRFPERFLRVHRNALVDRNRLRALFRNPAGADCVEIEGIDVQPEVSRRNLPAVRRALKDMT
ncbi:LytR/AlgR family response regulator transcription factor [Wenzhouxiangella marina]|uniref:Chemotaxis protein CheY n=1 Tax=Wenzhouxiangella marina TaxID=1579979 RepID=A0A0K0XX87_9GAMM|nr:LytTR family DNA-binding domain-containing protein [Wenzhouxiangella marina]AKS42298.1 chemotaxis protein CheY [Wenzhouxiangella marina]MBB6085929.1 two-component system response regulator AlgR [Wenzhouxiangella marina]